MSDENRIKEEPVAPSPDLYMQTFRKALEHIVDGEWLNRNSPLASIFFAGTAISTNRQRQLGLTGRPELDRRLRTIWHDWEQRAKTPMQSLVWKAVCELPMDLENQLQAILLLTYFDIERPKQRQVIKMLAMGRSTYYRYLDRAVETLGHAITKSLRPALRLEQPVTHPLIGRTREIAQALRTLGNGNTVHIVGGSGLGKTVLAAHLAARWPHDVFWYTFRPGLTDSPEQLLYAVAYFLHEQGSSGLWLYLSTNSEPLPVARALLALRQQLAELRETPPLFCFDEVDLLLTDELHDSAEYLQLRQLLEEWSITARAGSPLLLIGQKLLLAPEAEGLIQLAPFTEIELGALLDQAKISLTPDQSTHLLRITRGNPLLLRLFLVLHQQSTSLLETIERLTTPLALDWLMARLEHHLSATDQLVLHELAVFANEAPEDVWRRGKARLESLIKQGLVQRSSDGGVGLHPALRKVVYDRLPATRKIELHLAASHLLAVRGRFTEAAWHYIQAERPELAIWTWYMHRQQEIEQGQSGVALAMFLPLTSATLPRADDKRALVLLLAPLLKRVGRAQEALMLFDETTWPPQFPSGALAHEQRGDLLAEVGNVEAGLSEMRLGLETLSRMRATQEVELHLQMGRRALGRLGDIEQTRHHLVEARVSLDVLQGRLEEATGNYESARSHLTSALQLARQTSDQQRLAKIHEGLGVLEARNANLEAAIEHLDMAGELYRSCGNEVAAVGFTNSGLAMAYIIMRRYADAIPPAETALAFFRDLNLTYWMAINETYLAEAWLYLDDLEKAEKFAQTALRQEEVTVRPYCLFLLGHVRRRQQRFVEAERLCRDAIEMGESMSDPWAQGPAWMALAETMCDAGNVDESHAAMAHAIEIFTELAVAHEIEHAQKVLAEIESKARVVVNQTTVGIGKR